MIDNPKSERSAIVHYSSNYSMETEHPQAIKLYTNQKKQANLMELTQVDPLHLVFTIRGITKKGVTYHMSRSKENNSVMLVEGI